MAAIKTTKAKAGKPSAPASSAPKPVLIKGTGPDGSLSYHLARKAMQTLVDEGRKAEADRPWSGDPKYVVHGLDKDGLVLRKGRLYYRVPDETVLGDGTVLKADVIKPKIVRPGELKYDPRLFEFIPTDTGFDGVFSRKGGIAPATNYLVYGDPGSGKTTVLLKCLAGAQASGRKCLFVSGEMNRIDMAEYVERDPSLGEVPTLFLSDHTDVDTKQLIEETLKQGWDLVLLDSASEICGSVQEDTGMTTKRATSWLIDLMVDHNLGPSREEGPAHEGDHFTTFLAIQQVTKGGDFVGSKKWSHNTTGTLKLVYDQKDESRSMVVIKNRRGCQFNSMEFSLGDHGVVTQEELAAARAKEEEAARQAAADMAEKTADFSKRFFAETPLDGIDKLGKAKDEGEEVADEVAENA